MADQLTGAHLDELERLYTREAGKLWRSLLAATGSREIADDAVSEAFTVALERFHSIRSPGPWVWRTAFRLAWRDVRRRKREGGAVLETAYEDRHGNFELMHALQRLSPKQRASVVLYYYADLPVKEVAATMGTTSAAARVHLSRGRKRLRYLLEGDHD